MDERHGIHGPHPSYKCRVEHGTALFPARLRPYWILGIATPVENGECTLIKSDGLPVLPVPLGEEGVEDAYPVEEIEIEFSGTEKEAR